jgi:uncharacterized Fe-S cluster-containing radical SAM superfamily protein
VVVKRKYYTFFEFLFFAGALWTDVCGSKLFWQWMAMAERNRSSRPPFCHLHPIFLLYLDS